ncbi:MAG: bifunctional BirA, biotin operon repressor/biotin--acetyl-CoA-carboxylase ligase [Bacillales bacterium]|nr:bifunctional BirA, biotin operon repressor/biotin--acetyl-CoA-carboxylase ligase [Bacillales bacterium]
MDKNLQTSTIQKLIFLLVNNDNEFLSGQKLSAELGVSRTAVWKHIEELRKEGYDIEAVARKGYKLLSIPDAITAKEILNNLSTNIFGKDIFFYQVVTSTQKIATEMAMSGAAEGTVIVAEEQTEGRGRLQRKWHTPSGNSVAMSIIIRPRILLSSTPHFTLLVAVSIVKAIKDISTLNPKIKWPNDILINGKKSVGILTELNAEADQINFLIVGIGINVNQVIDDLPKEIQNIATSLAIEDGKKFRRAELIRSILTNLEYFYEKYIKEGFTSIKDIWEKESCTIGENIIAKTSLETIEGRAVGITNDGILLLEDKEGNIHNIISGDIFIDTK